MPLAVLLDCTRPCATLLPTRSPGLAKRAPAPAPPPDSSEDEVVELTEPLSPDGDEIVELTAPSPQPASCPYPSWAVCLLGNSSWEGEGYAYLPGRGRLSVGSG